MAQREQTYWIGDRWVPASQVPQAMKDAYNAGLTGTQVKRDPNTGEPVRSPNGEYEFEPIPMSDLSGGQGTDTLAGAGGTLITYKLRGSRTGEVSPALTEAVSRVIEQTYGPGYTAVLRSGAGHSTAGTKRHTPGRADQPGVAADFQIFAPDGHQLAGAELDPLLKNWVGIEGSMGANRYPGEKGRNFTHMDLIGGIQPYSVPLGKGEDVFWTYGGLDPKSTFSKEAQKKMVASGAFKPQSVAATTKSDPAVSQLQTYLAKNGFDPGPVNGVMSEQTMTALNSYNAAADPQGAAAAQAALAQSGVTNPTPQQMADAFKQASTARLTAMSMGQSPAQAPTPQDVTALALDGMDTEAPPAAQQAIDDMLTGQSSEQVLAGGPRQNPRGMAPATAPIAPDVGSFARSVADVLDEGPRMDPRRAGPATGPMPANMGAMRSPDDVLAAGPRMDPREAIGSAPVGPTTAAGFLETMQAPPRRPGGAPDAAMVPTPPPRASGLPTPPPRPDINDPSLSFNAPEYQGGGPTSGPAPAALADQLDTMVAGREEFPGALPAASRTGDLSAAMGNAPPAAAPNPYDDWSREFDVPGPFTMANERMGVFEGSPSPSSLATPPPPTTPPVGNVNYADMPSGRLPQTQGAVMEPGSGAGPYGGGIPPAAAFDTARMDDGLKAPINIPETYAQLLDMPEGMNDAAFGKSFYPGLIPWEREVVAGASPDELSLDAMPDSGAGRLFNANQPTTTDRVMSILDEGRAPTVSLVGGPRDQAADIGTYNTGEWMTGPDSDIIGRAQGWWESPPEPDMAGFVQGDYVPDADQRPSFANSAAISPEAIATAAVLEAGDVGAATAVNAVSGNNNNVMPYSRGPFFQPVYLPDAADQGMVLSEFGQMTTAGANRPIHSGGDLVEQPAATSGVAPVTVQAPQLGGGRLSGKSGGLFGMGANWAGPQWTGNVTTGNGPSGQWWSGQTNAMGGSEGLSWQGSDGRTITAYSNDGGRTYTHGYGPQV